ncbi:MAG: hypothetical protein ACLRZG_08700 [Streptococcus sp.]
MTVMEFMTAVSGVASGWAAYFKGLLANLGWSSPHEASNGTLIQLCAELMWISLALFWSMVLVTALGLS